MAYFDGELPADQIPPQAVRHIEMCVDCASAGADAKRLSHEMSQWEVEEAPQRLTDAVTVEIEQFRQRNGKRTKRFAFWPESDRMKFVFAGSAVIVLFLVFISVAPLLWPVGHYRMVAESKMDRFVGEPSMPALPAGPPPGLNAESANRIQDLSDLSQLELDQQKNNYETAQDKFGANSSQETGQQGQGAGRGSALKSATTVLRREGAAGGAQSVASPADGAMIIRTVLLNMITNDFDNARVRIDTIVNDAQGYVEQLQIGKGRGTARTLTATLRFPAGKLDTGLNALRDLGQVQNESQQASDVSQQYVDLSARLKNARNTEQRLLAMLRERTGDLKDVIEAEREISRVREQIEQMDAQLQGLSKKVAFSTVQVNLSEEFKAKLDDGATLPSTRTRLGNAAVNGYHLAAEAVLSIVLFLLTYGPTLLLLAIFLLFVALVAWKAQKRFATATPK